MSSQTIFITKGSTDVTRDIGPLLQDNSGTNPGDPLTGLVYNSTGLVCYYREGAAGAVTQLTLATQTVTSSTHVDGGFVELSSTNMPGMYRLDLSDTIVSGTNDEAILTISGHADLATHTVHIILTNFDLYDAVRGGLTALPNAAADAAGGLPISDAGGLDMDAILVDTNSLNDTKIPNTLNTTASGNIGIDWANVENPTTTLDLSATSINLCDTVTTNTDMRGTDNALLAVSAPTNFGDLAITVTTGQVTVGTNNDKTGYTVSTVSDKTGYSISGTITTLDGLNNISTGQVNTEVDTALADIGLDHLISSALPTGWATDVAAGSVFDNIADDGTASYDRTTDSLQAVRDSISSGSTPQLLQSTTIATLASQTSFTLTAGSTDDDAYNNQMIIVTDQTTSTQKAVGLISDYTGSTRTVTLDADPGIYTMAVGDTVDIIAVTGSPVGLEVDANGYVTVATNNDKTGYSISGTLTTLDALDTAQDTQHAQTQSDIAGLNNISTTQVKTEADNALSDIGLDHLISSSLPTDWGTDVAAGSVFDNIADNGTAAYDRTTDSLQAIRDRGDSAWITGGGGGLTQILNMQPVLPYSIDLANTATARLGLILINSLDDLPSTAEITPGTISIDRKAIGGTSWSAVVTDAAMSEQAGMVYYDEVFDSGTGYAEGDSIRVTFKSVSITADANTHEICDANGIIFQTEIRQTMRGTDGANTTTPLDAAGTRSAVGLAAANLDTQLGDIPTVSEFNARTLTAADYFDPAADTVANVTTVGSVTGAVGSVTGNVGGNVTGSVGSVTGNINTAAGTIQTLDALDTAQDAQHATTQGLVDDLAIKKNTAFSNFEFLMILASDHVTPATGLTVTGQRSIDGGAFASVSGSIAEVSNGIYQFDALAADTNGDVITWRFSSATADDTFVTFKTVA